jgi:hypothetical protein
MPGVPGMPVMPGGARGQEKAAEASGLKVEVLFEKQSAPTADDVTSLRLVLSKQPYVREVEVRSYVPVSDTGSAAPPRPGTGPAFVNVGAKTWVITVWMTFSSRPISAEPEAKAGPRGQPSPEAGPIK